MENSPLRSYGRLKARPIKPRQAALMQSLLPQIRAPQTPFEPMALMPAAREVWLEIGFGGGEHMAGQATRWPDVLVIGCEPFFNGVGSAVRHVDEQSLANVRIHAGDARDVMARLPAGCLTRIFVLFPDPWPKARHQKRRLVQDDTIAEFSRLLAPGGRFRFATDWADYADWALIRLRRAPHLTWLARTADDWRNPRPDHLTTRYETKKLGDCAPIWLEFEKV